MIPYMACAVANDRNGWRPAIPNAWTRFDPLAADLDGFAKSLAGPVRPFVHDEPPDDYDDRIKAIEVRNATVQNWQTEGRALVDRVACAEVLDKIRSMGIIMHAMRSANSTFKSNRDELWFKFDESRSVLEAVGIRKRFAAALDADIKEVGKARNLSWTGIAKEVLNVARLDAGLEALD